MSPHQLPFKISRPKAFAAPLRLKLQKSSRETPVKNFCHFSAGFKIDVTTETLRIPATTPSAIPTGI